MLSLAFIYITLGVRLALRCASDRQFSHARYDTEIILCVVLMIGTGSIGANTWRNVRFIQTKAAGTGLDEEEMDIQLKVGDLFSFMHHGC